MSGMDGPQGDPGRRGARATGLARLLAVVLALPAAAKANDCKLPGWAGQPITSGPVRLAWRADPAPIQVSRGFRLEVVICPPGTRLMRVDATMPEHRHGMNYRPSLQSTGPGRWQVDGMLWHMPGRWELRFDVESAGRPQDLRQSVELK